jgi:hypothetical protein
VPWSKLEILTARLRIGNGQLETAVPCASACVHLFPGIGPYLGVCTGGEPFEYSYSLHKSSSFYVRKNHFNAGYDQT